VKTQFRQTMQLGELIAAAFDEAALYSNDPWEVSQLAAGAVMHVLQGARRQSISTTSERIRLLEGRSS
jgi:hypothetical protein